MNNSRIYVSGALALLSASLAFGEIQVAVEHNGNDNTGAPATGSAGAPVPLDVFFNKAGIYPDDLEFSGGLDDSGWACSSNLLGSAQVWNGIKFNLGSAGASNVVSCSGQTIPLPAGNFSSLDMLATAVNGDQESQSFSVTYTNAAAPQTVTQSVSDWFTPENYSGETQAITMAYRNQSDGTKDERPFYIYGYKLSLSQTNTVKSLTLPDNANLRVFAVTLVP